MITEFYINGIEFSDDVDGLDAFTIEYALDNESKTFQRAISNNFVFSGKAFELVEAELINSSNAEENSLEVTIISDCCSKAFDFVLNARGVAEYCPADSIIEGTLAQENRETVGFECLRNKVFYTDKNGIAFKSGLTFPKIRYGRDFGFIQGILFIVGIILLPILAILEAIEALLGFLGADFNIPSLDDFQEALTGTGKYHSTVRLKDMFARNCEQCNLGFNSSTILDSGIYSNTLLFSAISNDGTDINTESTNTEYYDTENAPNLSVIQMAEELETVFNSDVQIIDNTLHFQKTEFFDTLTVPFLNIDEAYEEALVSKPRYSTLSQTRFANFNGSYSSDGQDTEGNRILNGNLTEEGNELNASYADRVEWNPNSLSTRKGTLDAINNFSPARFDSDSKNRPIYRALRNGAGFNDVLIMERGTASNMKLLIWDGLTPLDAKIIKRPSTTNSGLFDFNWPFYINENYPEPELYQNFWAMESPDHEGRFRFEIPSIDHFPENFCETVNMIDSNGTNLEFESMGLKGKAESIKVDLQNIVITYENIKLR